MPLNLAYSFSRISDYDCKRRFAKKYIEKKKEPVTVIASIGRVGHDAMKTYINALYLRKVESDKDLLRKAVDHAIGQKDRRGWPDHFSSIDIDNVKSSVIALFDSFVFNIDFNVKEAHVEKQLAFNSQWSLLGDSAWFETKGVYFRAILDWAYIPANENTLWIVDHKTGWGEPDESQLKYYALAAFAGISHTIERIGIKFHWIAQGGRMEDKGFFEPSDMVGIRDEVNTKIIEIENNTDWETPTPGKYCDYCGFTEDCPAVQTSMKQITSGESFQVNTKEAAEKALEMFILVNARLADLNKALQGYVRRNGPVSAAGKIMESRKKETWTLEDPYGLQKAMIRLGIHPTDIMASTGITVTNLKDLLKKHDVIRHLEKLQKNHGKLQESMGEIKPYVLKKKGK